MKTKTLLMQTLGLTLLWAHASAPLFAQEFDAATELSNRGNGAASQAEIAPDFTLNGVLISKTGRTALINNRISREGDRVGGAEILAITEGAVRVLAGSREFTVRVGSTVISERPAGTDPAQLIASDAVHRDTVHGPVRQGETLSHIAERYLTDGTTMNQMMMALFQANPRAFSSNINVLREGFTLRIPQQNELHGQSPAVATAAVRRHMDAWKTNHQPRTQLAKVNDPDTYGPVASGETLSGISSRVSHDTATLNQMMIALYEANPQAFGGNINILHKGATLRIPGLNALIYPSAEAATAEVLKHIDSWRPASGQRPRLAGAVPGGQTAGEPAGPTVRPPIIGEVVARR